MSVSYDSDQGYDGQSEDDSDGGEEERPPHRRKRYTRRSRPPPPPPDSSGSEPASGGGPSDVTAGLQRSDSGHALFFDAELNAWRRQEVGVRKTQKPNARLKPEEVTPVVKELRRTPSGSKVVFDIRRQCWRREKRRKTVNYDLLTEAQRSAKKTASGTDIYYDETRLEWRRRTFHDSDVSNPSRVQTTLKRTASGSAMIFDEGRQVWKRKLKRKLIVDPHALDISQYPNSTVVNSQGQWYLQKKRKHLEPGELSEKQIAARRTGSGTPIFYDEVLKKWQRQELLPPARPSGPESTVRRRRRHRHHHGAKRVSYLYTKNKLTGRWTKQSFKAANKHAKRLRTVDGGFIYFDYSRKRWRKCERDGDQMENRGFFARIREFFFGDSDDSLDENQANPCDGGRTESDGYTGHTEQTYDGRKSNQHLPARTHRSEKEQGGFLAMMRRFFRSICCWLRLC